MSVMIIILEAWMIIRLTKIIIQQNLWDKFSYYFQNYYINYLVLITTGIVTLVFSSLSLKGKLKARQTGRFLLLSFSFICLCFGIKVALNDYSKGEQILVFATMCLYALCLLTWRPIITFFISSLSFLYMYFRMNSMIAVNTGNEGVTDATKINFFILWISIMMVCISSYNNTRSQAIKDENLLIANKNLKQLSITDDLTGIHNMVYFRQEAENINNNIEGKLFLFFDLENFKSYNENTDSMKEMNY